MKNTVIIGSLILLLGACSQADDLFSSYGPEITETRQVGEFRKISAGEKFDVELVQDSARAGTIEITAGAHVIDGYTSKVSGGELRLLNENHFNWVRKLKVRQKAVIYFSSLEELQIKGSAKFSCRDSIINRNEFRINHDGLEDARLKIHGDYIYVNNSNTGGVILRGNCFLLSASVDDISFVRAEELNADKCYISSFSQENSYVNARSVLDIKLYGNGSIFYSLIPAQNLLIEDKGKGSVIRYSK